MDTLTKEKRSWNMSKIRSKNTKPEIAVRSKLHKAGYRFRLHVKGLPGKPDIVLPKYNTIIFINGCFWHRHKGCEYAYKPKTRVDFWNQKLNRNIKRQDEVIKELRDLEWKVLVIWECEVGNEKLIRDRFKLIKKKSFKN
ncbi:MAG TPA: DNA mismatch endonuclease Vsr [Nitrospina sp.]|nr:DNA mismatch endonuclease Vsr [Nitrospina sp.]